ncbi:hypothetical protein HK097_010826 [Rhizophlyctis rosea]|uniref:Letm1 RBD domain-containing protein n=1 Tax=Rhizophlyctis rosea TaxID=64517 RepID=A0AAD5SP44_9FUNG|nr:hypothetical protein HK097_010826 [Rhizophlyctis rosea]
MPILRLPSRGVSSNTVVFPSLFLPKHNQLRLSPACITPIRHATSPPSGENPLARPGFSKLVKEGTSSDGTGTTSKISSYIEKAKATMKQYYDGAFLLKEEGKVAKNLKFKSDYEGYELTRKEYMLIERNKEDKRRLYPFFALLIILPESIPIVLLKAPGMIPSTMQSTADVEKRWAAARKTRLELGKQIVADPSKYGLHASPESFLKSSFLFSLSRDQSTAKNFSLDSLSSTQLKTINQYLGLWRFGPAGMLRKPLKNHLEVVRGDDKFLVREGIESLSLTDLRAACEARGITTAESSTEQLKADLQEWLDIGVQAKKEGVEVPEGLMLLTAAVRVGLRGGMAEPVKEEVSHPEEGQVAEPIAATA